MKPTLVRHDSHLPTFGFISVGTDLWVLKRICALFISVKNEENKYDYTYYQHYLLLTESRDIARVYPVKTTKLPEI